MLNSSWYCVLILDIEARELGSLFYLGLNPQANPYAIHIFQLSTEVAPIRFSMAASASCHLATILKDPKLELQFLSLRGRATKLLRQRLEIFDPGEARKDLAAILALTQLDVR